MPLRPTSYEAHCLNLLLDIETAEGVSQGVCDRLESKGWYSERDGVTAAGWAALREYNKRETDS